MACNQVGSSLLQTCRVRLNPSVWFRWTRLSTMASLRRPHFRGRSVSPQRPRLQGLVLLTDLSGVDYTRTWGAYGTYREAKPPSATKVWYLDDPNNDVAHLCFPARFQTKRFRQTVTLWVLFPVMTVCWAQWQKIPYHFNRGLPR